MKVTTAEFAAHLAGKAHTIARCLLLTRTDEQVFGFTTHDRDLEVDAVTYKTAPGILGAALVSRDGMEVDNTEVTGFFNAAGITLDEVRSGAWDHCSFRLFEVNWADLSMGAHKLLRGKLGQITTHSHLVVELRGMAAALDAMIGDLLTPGCPFSLGGPGCGKDLTDYTAAGEVTSVVDNREFDTDLATSTVRLTPSTTGFPTARYFEGGTLTWLTGDNAGRREVVKVYAADGRVELHLPMYYTIVAGDIFSVHRGCAKTREAECRDVFDNVIQFGGFDPLPGLEVTLKAGGQ